jgi:hypothetical protein
MMRNSLLLSCALLSAATSAASAYPMMRRAGQWEITMNAGPMGPMTQTVCFKTDKSASELSAMRGRMTKDCSTPSVSIGGSSVTVDTVCTGPTNGKVKVHAVITPSGPDAYRMDSHLSLEGMGDMTMVTDAKRVGPCQPGDKQSD